MYIPAIIALNGSVVTEKKQKREHSYHGTILSDKNNFENSDTQKAQLT